MCIRDRSSTFAHDSLLGGLNLFLRRDNRYIISAGERPPYPIIISNPTFTQVLRNMNRADLGIIIGFVLLSVPLGRYVSSSGSLNLFMKRKLFYSCLQMGVLFGSITAANNSFFRLTGHIENGLKWRRRGKQLNKYDLTSEYEKGTFWHSLRLRD
eukprot:TRINITY_DN530_c0_g1_i9.p3 TRINITY_DN530_c0_g1~~TRINITY_DN530_c0_g1_i9.p3  ORF type:complete len:155 (+),score=17.60 TRINITY_DN530_c0_g1_i9:92-556(+)